MKTTFAPIVGALVGGALVIATAAWNWPCLRSDAQTKPGAAAGAASLNKMVENTHGSTTASFFRKLDAMTLQERLRHVALSHRLREAMMEKRKLPNGYAFRLAHDGMSLPEVAEWISLERKCCPFFDFQIEAQHHSGPIWLRLTGAEGVKAFIESDFGV